MFGHTTTRYNEFTDTNPVFPHQTIKNVTVFVPNITHNYLLLQIYSHIDICKYILPIGHKY